MKFEYHPEKSAANKIKHGIGFDEAQTLWLDPFLIEAPARIMGEPRFFGCWQDRCQALGCHLHSPG